MGHAYTEECQGFLRNVPQLVASFGGRYAEMVPLRLISTLLN